VDGQRISHALIVTKLGCAVPVDARIERTYRVRFDEAGADGHLRGSGFVRYAQDLAWIHSESAGFGRDWYASHGLTWLARSVELEIIGDVPYGAELDVSTEVIGFRRVWARRRTEFKPHGGERLLGVAITDWVLLNARGVPVRPPAEVVDNFPVRATEFTPLRIELPEPANGANQTTSQLSARLSDLDPLGHVNNAAYLDYVDEHLVASGRRADVRRHPRRYQLEFLASAEPGMALTAVGWESAGRWCYRLSAVARELVRARFESADGSWVGG